MEIKQLQCFLMVASTLNFSRAAEALYMSQPALSYQITELERELGLSLFDRNRRKVLLTAAGTALIEPAREIVSQSKELPERIRRECEEECGTLRIGFDNTEDHYEMIGITSSIAQFAKENPCVGLSMERADFQECLDHITDGDLDIAFLVMRSKEYLPSDMCSKIIFESSIIMAVSQGCDIDTCQEAVQKLDLLMVDEKPRGNSRILRTLEKMKLKPHLRNVDSLPTGFVYAEMGKGIMLLSETYYKAHSYTDRFKIIEIPDEAAKIKHVAVWRRDSNNYFIDSLMKEFDKNPLSFS